MPTIKLTHFVVSKDEWDTKEATGKYVLHGERYVKRHLSGWSDVEQKKNQDLAIVDLCKSEGIRQAFSKSVSQ